MKQRLDHILVEKGLAESRSQAEALIMSGVVFVDGVRRDKPGFHTEKTADIYVQSPPQYVSRAGAKLASANNKFNLDFRGAVVLDVGSSTGGFSDYAVQQGAGKVYAVDVGTNQLHEKLRADDRVVVMERTDIREASLPERADIGVVDVSFISLRAVLPYVAHHITPGGYIIAMCKPQFEAGVKDATKHKGIIKNDRLRRDILKRFDLWLTHTGFAVRDKADSNVKGAKGNVERFYLIQSPTK